MRAITRQIRTTHNKGTERIMEATEHTDHVEAAREYIDAVEKSKWSADLMAQIAQVHATLAVAEELRAIRTHFVLGGQG
jgi:F420-dependent methylenetetrahydromethanopterin dehydrogenase